MTACASQGPASLNGLEQVFHDPGFAVQGKTRKDQVWISSTQETGIRVLGWARPKGVAGVKVVKAKIRHAAKPTRQILLPTPKPTTEKENGTVPAVESPPVEPKKTILQRLKDENKSLNERVRKLEGRQE
jgi:hypothetical protein